MDMQDGHGPARWTWRLDIDMNHENRHAALTSDVDNWTYNMGKDMDTQ